MSMNDKPHTPYDAAPMDTPRASEPMVTYGHVATTESPLYHPTSYEMEEEWLCPMTMADIHHRIDEAEAEIEAGEVMTCEEANAEIRRLLPWLL